MANGKQPVVEVMCGERSGSLCMNGLIVKSALVGALGGLLFGFDTAVIAGSTHSLRTDASGA